MDSYLTLSRVSEGSPVLQFSIFASLAFKLPSVIFFFAAAGLSYSLNVNFSFLLAAANSSSFSFHLSPCFATCIQVWFFFTSLPLVASVSSGLKRSFTSSSQSFPQSTHCSACLDLGTKSWVPIQQLSLPIVLLVAMLFSLPIAISFFCAFRSNTESWLPSFNLFV